MRITGAGYSPAPSYEADGVDGDIADELDAAALEEGQNQLKQDGAAALSLLDAALASTVQNCVNRPLSEGPVGRLINLKI